MLCTSSYSPVADPSVVNTCTVISSNDGLLRTSTGFIVPASSLTLYVGWLNFTVIAVEDSPTFSSPAVIAAVQKDTQYEKSNAS